MIPLCGGNIDSTVLGRCIDRGLAADGRLCRFIVTVSDRPGGIAELTRLLASLGARYASSCLLKSISQVAYEKLSYLTWVQNSLRRQLLLCKFLLQRERYFPRESMARVQCVQCSGKKITSFECDYIVWLHYLPYPITLTDHNKCNLDSERSILSPKSWI